MTGKPPPLGAERGEGPAPVHDTMRRLQIGIAGVLTVLLLVGMAELIGDRARENVAQETGVAKVEMPGDENQGNAGPLEELGVQPVAKEPALEPGAGVPHAPPIATVPDLEPDPELARARQSQQ